MKNLSAIVIVALGLVFCSSCARGYGCPYGAIENKEIIPTPLEKAIPTSSPVAIEAFTDTAC